jgi:hypothetical protein
VNTENNNAHMALHGMVAALVFCAAVAVFFRFAPYHETPKPETTNPIVDCLPSGSGGPCIPFDKIQEMMSAQPDVPEVIPPNPATTKEEKI